MLALVHFSFFPVRNPEVVEWHCELCVRVCPVDQLLLIGN